MRPQSTRRISQDLSESNKAACSRQGPQKISVRLESSIQHQAMVTRYACRRPRALLRIRRHLTTPAALRVATSRFTTVTDDDAPCDEAANMPSAAMATFERRRHFAGRKLKTIGVRTPPLIRTIQVRPKDLPTTLRQAEGAVN